MLIYSDEDEELRLLFALYEYSKCNRLNGLELVEEIYDFFELHDYITQSQYNFLKKIYEKNDVHDYYEKYMEANK